METLTVMRVSASKLTTFRDCRINYASRYLLHQKPATETTYSFLGSGMHAAIEAAYQNEYPYDVFDRVVAERFKDVEGKPLMGYSVSEIQRKGYEWLDTFNYELLTPEHIEYSFKYPITTNCLNSVEMNGFIDYIGGITGHTGTYILDFKTNKQKPSKREVNNHWQLKIYLDAYRECFGKEPAGLGIFHIPTDTIIFADMASLDALTAEIEQTIDDMIWFTEQFNRSEALEQCNKCSIFCALKWNTSGE